MTWAISLGRLISCTKIGNAWLIKSVNQGWDYIIILSYITLNKQHHNK